MEGCAYSKDDEVMSKLFYYRDCFNRTLIHHHTVLILDLEQDIITPEY
jgi:hypothetical protein